MEREDEFWVGVLLVTIDVVARKKNLEETLKVVLNKILQQFYVYFPTDKNASACLCPQMFVLKGS